MDQTKNFFDDNQIIQNQFLDSALVMDTNTVKQSRCERKKVKREKFISVEMFNQLALKSTINWNDLSQDCIYKMEKVCERDDQQVADLTNRDGITVPVFLPEFVNKKLSSIDGSNVTLYLRPYRSAEGENQIDIASVQKHVCKNCNKKFASSHTLWVHRKKFCKT